MIKNSPHLIEETKITWLENPRQFPYLRETTELLPLRVRFPLRYFQKNGQLRVIGYSEISVTAKNIHDGFYRRVWFLKKPNDPYAKGCPWEGVKPSTIKPRFESKFGRE